MKNNLSKIATGLFIAALVASPSLANVTDLTLQANVQDLVTLQIERVSNSNVVSNDNTNPTNTSLTANEILNFGNVNALGLSPITNTAIGTNGTTGTVLSRVYNTTGNVDLITEAKTSTYDGALYVVQNELQVRALKTGATSTTDIDVKNQGDMKVVLADQSVYSFATSDTIAATHIINNNNTNVPFTSALANNTPKSIDVGVIIPPAMTNGPKQSVITFTGT